METNRSKANLRERDAGGAAVAVDLVGRGGAGGVRVHESFRRSAVQDRAARHRERLMVDHPFDLLRHVSWNWKSVIFVNAMMAPTRGGWKRQGGQQRL